LETNNHLSAVIRHIFTLSVVFIGIPSAFYLLIKGIEGIFKFGRKKFPDKYLITSGLGTYSWEILLYGFFIFAFSIWYLFIDKGGRLVPFINEIRRIFD